MFDRDPRIPVRFGAFSDAEPHTALLIESDMAAPPGIAVARFEPARFAHAAGCACCVPRGPAAEALCRLFLTHARRQGQPLRAVVAITRSEAGRRAVCAALDSDPLSVARFRRA